MNNAELASAFYELADLLELSQEPDFRVRAFRSAARAIETLSEPAEALLAAGGLKGIPGIGAGTVRRIVELTTTGRMADLEALRAKLPAGLLQMLRLPDMGPKTVELVHRELGLSTIEEVEAAARAGRLRALPRFGQKREEKLLRGIEEQRRHEPRWTLPQALPHAERILDRVREAARAGQVALCGSLRRGRETVGDLDVLAAVSTRRAPAVLAAFAAMPEVAEVLARGETKATVRLRSGLSADLRVVKPESFGAALHYFTGSRDHNIALRTLAVRRGLKVSEYGIFDEEGRRLGGAEEHEVFAAVGLPWIPPELRENRGELEAAALGRLPELITAEDIRGDLHMHTKETDGRSTLEEMVTAAREAGRDYVAITDHSQALAMAKGLDAARLRAQGRQIREVNERFGGAPLVLRGIEADILPDGSVDLGPAVLGELDWVIGSVHSMFDLPGEEQTRRVIRALESGVIDCLGHPTGRILGRRPPYAIDIERVLAAARRVGAAVELNASPHRLDLDDTHVRMAKEMGVLVVLNTDSHSTRELAHLRYGIQIARRGWLEAKDVANTRSYARFRELFGRKLRRAA